MLFLPTPFMPQPGGAGGLATFDPLKTTSGAVLSGGNLQVNFSNPGSSMYYALSTNGHSTGKFYCEFTLEATFSGNVYAIGFGFGVAASVTDPNGIGNNGTDNAGVWVSNSGDKNLYQNGNTPTTTNITWTQTTGDIIAMALDLTNRRIWYRLNGGNWNANVANNPATNTGGIDVTPSLSGSTVYALVCGSTSPAGTHKINFGGTAYNNAAPAGFSNW